MMKFSTLIKEAHKEAQLREIKVDDESDLGESFVQKELNKIAVKLNQQGFKTYVSSMKSPNMGIRIFIDIE